MVELGIANIAMFFVIVGICLIFVVVWIVKSESRINLCKAEINRLKAQVESAEREKFSLSEKVASLESAGPYNPMIGQGGDTPSASLHTGDGDAPALLLQALEQNSNLEKENRKLKAELDEATKSLEDIYKALVDNKTEA